MEIKGVYHCSFTVMDIDKTVDFYTNILGLQLIRRGINEGDNLGASLGLGQAKAKLRIAFMKAGDTEIEFIQYEEPKSKPCPRDPSIAGQGHIAFEVDDIYETKKKLETAGIEFNSDINIIEKGDFKGFKWCYFRDFNGITMEILQEG
jgi:catechol 2,3-dioxygenase-like lactoylglutathione lyase family enzyme